MKAVVFLFLALAGATTALPAQQVIIYRPAPAVTVVSPLTPPAAQSGQALLTQINGTLTQRRFEHQVLTTNAAINAATINAAAQPRR